MRIGAIVGVLLALTQATVAEEEWLVEKPPAEYMVEPAQPYRIRWTSLEKVTHACRGELALGYIKAVADGRKPKAPPRPYACTNPETRVVLVDRTIQEQHPLVDQVIWHELAHLNGWYHPARY